MRENQFTYSDTQKMNSPRGGEICKIGTLEQCQNCKVFMLRPHVDLFGMFLCDECWEELKPKMTVSMDDLKAYQSFEQSVENLSDAFCNLIVILAEHWIAVLVFLIGLILIMTFVPK